MKRTRRARPSIVIAAAAMTGALVPLGAGAGAEVDTLRFTDPVAVAPALAEAWEPTMLADSFGNIFVTARRTTTQLALAPDERSPTASRSSSWLWTSTDRGATFRNLAGLPADAQSHEWGYEGDFALDDAGHLYFVDQTYADSTISRWTVDGLGSYRFDFHRPFLPTAQPVDDRPWLAARGDGSVFYVTNAGDAALQPTGHDGGEAYGPGRFTVYRSTDGATTFEPVGHALRQSGACRPAADRRPGHERVYIACTNDGGAPSSLDEPTKDGTLWAYVSADDGATYARHRIGGYDAEAETYDWPLVAVAPDGDIFVLHVDAATTEVDSDGATHAVTNTLNLFRSRDAGRTWTRRDITGEAGRYRWGWLTVAPTGRVAVAIQHRAAESEPWRAYAAVFDPDGPVTLSPIDDTPVSAASNPEPPSELMGLAFLPDGTLAVAWTRVESAGALNARHVYFARSTRPVAPPRRSEPKPAPKAPAAVKGVKELPATGVAAPVAPATVAGALAVAGWMLGAGSRRRRARR